MIFCYSGTGNSYYIAQRIADELHENIIDLNEKIKTNNYSSIETGNTIILVVPTYAWRIPRIVSSWFYKTEFVGAKRIWFVMNCGSEIGNASKYNSILANEKHLNYMGTKQILMPENYIAMFNAPQLEEAKEIVEKAEIDIKETIKYIKEGKSFLKPRHNLYDCFMSGSVNSLFYHFFVKADAFKVNNTCIGCNQCVKKCPLNNIQLIDGKPVWGKNCTHCMACICYCPQEAIEYGKKSVGKTRYHFEQLKIK